MCTDWIQAISGLLLVVVTIFYVIYTKKLTEESSNTFLNLIQVTQPDFMGCNLKIMNYGPGHALKINVLIEMNGPNGVEKLTAIGPNVLPNNAIADYKIADLDFGITIENRIYIDYQNQTGRKYHNEWIYTVGGSEPRIRLIK